jgi:integrase
MGYECKKHRVLADGSIYWVIHFRDRTKAAIAAGKDRKFIKRDELLTIGINPKATFDEAKAACDQLNARDKRDRAAARSKVRALARASGEMLVKSIFLPELDVANFQAKVLFNRFCRDPDSIKGRRYMSHWLYVQKMIAKLEIDPSDYHDDAFRFYRYFQDKKTSPEYVTKLLRILNAWGHFVCRQHAKAFLPVSMPRGRERQDIARAYRAKKGARGPADRLTPEALEQAQPRLIDYNYNWLYLSVWLGLRSEEVDCLRKPDPALWRLGEENGTPVLWVFQTKLVSVEQDKAWKPIPLVELEQQKCVTIIQEGNFKRPLNKILRALFPDRRIRTYSGRKGFTDLMLDRKYDLVEISVWMGHTSIETTWARYKDRTRVVVRKKAA